MKKIAVPVWYRPNLPVPDRYQPKTIRLFKYLVNTKYALLNNTVGIINFYNNNSLEKI